MVSSAGWAISYRWPQTDLDSESVLVRKGGESERPQVSELLARKLLDLSQAKKNVGQIIWTKKLAYVTYIDNSPPIT